jgi:putative phosphoserine phosphatase/1-acylglycerol-3-phosphate O-acyltransferase
MSLYERLTEEIRSGPSGPELAAFFDLDQTLLAGFSATSFVWERVVTGRMAPRELADTLLGALSFAAGRTGFSGLMSATTAAYRGLAESVLEELGEEVFDKYLATQIYPESRALVQAHRDAGHTVAIVSSATRYQAEPMARELGIAHVLCTRLEVENGVFTGRIIRPTCYGEGKATAAHELAARHDIDVGQSWFYTDSDEDLPLLEIVGRPRPTNPNRGSRRSPRSAAGPCGASRAAGVRAPATCSARGSSTRAWRPRCGPARPRAWSTAPSGRPPT